MEVMSPINISNDEESIPSLIISSSNGYDAKILTFKSDADDQRVYHAALVSSVGSSFIDTLLGTKSDEALRLLLTAVNNRTKERNYFKLYCDMLDGSITENDFDKEMEINEKEYVVYELETPSDNQLEIALTLSERIKSVDSIEDLSSLFSFNQKTTNLLLERNNG